MVNRKRSLFICLKQCLKNTKTITTSRSIFWRSSSSSTMSPNYRPSTPEAWLQYISQKLRQRNCSDTMIRRMFKSAISNVPDGGEEEEWWPHYINLWLKYAQFEESETRELERASQIYSMFLDLIPHERFSFDQVWISAAECAIKRSDLHEASTILESAMEKVQVPGHHIFRLYIDVKLELEDYDISRCRRLLENYEDENENVWLIYIEFERNILTPDRVRFLYDMVLNKPHFYRSEKLWKSYVNFEKSVGEFEKGKIFFEEFLRHKKDNITVWTFYARFAASVAAKLLEKEEEQGFEFDPKGKRVEYSESYVHLAKDILEKGIRYFKKSKRQGFVKHLRRESRCLRKNFDISEDVHLVTFDWKNRGTITLS